MKDAAITVIGSAGGNLVKFAIIANEYQRLVGRTGVGAIAGPKKLKGIVFCGNKKSHAWCA